MNCVYAITTKYKSRFMLSIVIMHFLFVPTFWYQSCAQVQQITQKRKNLCRQLEKNSETFNWNVSEETLLYLDVHCKASARAHAIHVRFSRCRINWIPPNLRDISVLTKSTQPKIALDTQKVLQQRIWSIALEYHYTLFYVLCNRDWWNFMQLWLVMQRAPKNRKCNSKKTR